MTLVISLLAVFGLFCLIWLAYGWLLLPCSCSIQVVVTAAGGGEGLEQTLRGLLWMRENRLWSGGIAIRDGGLTPEGLALALTLARRSGVEFAGRVPGC